MKKRTLPFHNTIAILALLIMTNNLVVGFPMNAEQDTWISMLLVWVIILPFILMLHRLTTLMPGKDFFDMIDFSMGRKIGVFIHAFYAIFFVLSASLILYSYANFAQMTSLYNTNIGILVLLYFLAALYLARSPLSTFGNWCAIFSIAIITLLIVITASASTSMDFSNLLPVLNHTPQQIAWSAILLSIIPFGDLFYALVIADSYDHRKSPKKAYFLTFVIGFAFLFVRLIRSLCLLGASILHTTLFQNYRSINVVHLSDFFARMEAIIAFIYLITGFARVSVALIGAAKSIAHMLSYSSENASNFINPIGFLAFTFGVMPFHGVTEMLSYMRSVHPALCAVFLFGFPLTLWVSSEWKHKRGNRKKSAENQFESVQKKPVSTKPNAAT